MDNLINYLKEFFDFIMKWAFEILDAALDAGCKCFAPAGYGSGFSCKIHGIGKSVGGFGLWVHPFFVLVYFLFGTGRYKLASRTYPDNQLIFPFWGEL